MVTAKAFTTRFQGHHHAETVSCTRLSDAMAKLSLIRTQLELALRVTQRLGSFPTL